MQVKVRYKKGKDKREVFIMLETLYDPQDFSHFKAVLVNEKTKEIFTEDIINLEFVSMGGVDYTEPKKLSTKGKY